MFRFIENRVPFLSHKLVDYSLQLPEEYIVSNNGKTKNIFKDAMVGILPDELANRKDKIGFATQDNLTIPLSSHCIDIIISGSKKIDILNKNVVNNILYNKKHTNLVLSDKIGEYLISYIGLNIYYPIVFISLIH